MKLKPAYILNTGEIAGGSNKLMLDLFNASGSGFEILLHALYIIPKTDAAVTGVVASRFDLHRTSSVGTSGTSIGYAGTDPTVANIVPLNELQEALPAGITGRVAPTGGATIANWLMPAFVFNEETSDASYSLNGLNILKNLPEMGPFVVRPGRGLLIKQGSVAGTNSFVFQMHFNIKERE